MFIDDLKIFTNNEQALTFIFDTFFNMLMEHEYEKCDEILENFNVEEFDTTISVGILIATSRYKKKLKNRKNLYLRFEKMVNSKYDEEESIKILSGLK